MPILGDSASRFIDLLETPDICAITADLYISGVEMSDPVRHIVDYYIKMYDRRTRNGIHLTVSADERPDVDPETGLELFLVSIEFHMDNEANLQDALHFLTWILSCEWFETFPERIEVEIPYYPNMDVHAQIVPEGDDGEMTVSICVEEAGSPDTYTVGWTGIGTLTVNGETTTLFPSETMTAPWLC